MATESHASFPCDNQIAIRCDRASGDNKGGLVSLKIMMQPSHAQCHRFASIGIEAVTCNTILLFPDPGSTIVQIMCLFGNID